MTFHHDGRVLSFQAAGETVQVRFIPEPSPLCALCQQPTAPVGVLRFTRNGEDRDQVLRGVLAAALYDRLCDMVGK